MKSVTPKLLEDVEDRDESLRRAEHNQRALQSAMDIACGDVPRHSDWDDLIIIEHKNIECPEIRIPGIAYKAKAD